MILNISPRLITTLCPPEKYLDAMVASVVTDNSVPAGLDITNLLRVEKVTAVDVVTLITRARPATLGLFKPCPVNSQQLRRVHSTFIIRWVTGNANIATVSGNDVSGHNSDIIFIYLFSFLSSVVDSSDRRSAQIKRLSKSGLKCLKTCQPFWTPSGYFDFAGDAVLQVESECCQCR